MVRDGSLRHRVDASVQTHPPVIGLHSTIHATPLTGSLTMIVFLTPVIILLNGICFFLAWRPIFMSNVTLRTTGESWPMAFYAYQCSLFFFFVVGHWVVVHEGFAVIVGQYSMHLRNWKSRATMVLFSMCCLPTFVSHTYLWVNTWSIAYAYDWLPGATCCVTGFFVLWGLWYPYTTLVADHFHRNVRRVADQAINLHHQQLHAGIRRTVTHQAAPRLSDAQL